MTVQPQTILLVDDNDDLREVTGEILESLGFRVLKAARGERALQLFEKNLGAVDYLLAEFVLPGMSGLKLADRLRARAPGLGVVILSSHNNHPDLRERLRLGQTLFLRKPFSLEELEATIAEAARHRGTQSPPAAAPRLGKPRRRAAPQTETQPQTRPVLQPAPRPGRQADSPSLRRAAWMAAAAAVLVFTAAGLSRFGASTPPPLPPWEAGTVARGSTIETLFPAGPLQEMPRELRWAEVPEARVYHITLQRVDQTVLWHTQSSTPRVRLPETLIEDLHPRVVYSWRVEARDSDDRRLAGSELVPFEVIPPHGQGKSGPMGAALPHLAAVGSSP
jgi:CheY-like chemotaxis protein